jgi:bis(5'-nucleosidyl)-tetraphosphatase
VFRFQEKPEFLLMRHPHRWDLPKGRAEAGESILETALRETEEETGIARDALRIDPDFRFEVRYTLPSWDNPSELLEKTVSYFLGTLTREVEIRVTEHPGFQWFPWNPPHRIQSQTVDPLLASLGRFWQEHPERMGHPKDVVR